MVWRGQTVKSTNMVLHIQTRPGLFSPTCLLEQVYDPVRADWFSKILTSRGKISLLRHNIPQYDFELDQSGIKALPIVPPNRCVCSLNKGERWNEVDLNTCKCLVHYKAMPTIWISCIKQVVCVCLCIMEIWWEGGCVATWIWTPGGEVTATCAGDTSPGMRGVVAMARLKLKNEAVGLVKHFWIKINSQFVLDIFYIWVCTFSVCKLFVASEQQTTLPNICAMGHFNQFYHSLMWVQPCLWQKCIWRYQHFVKQHFQ